MILNLEELNLLYKRKALFQFSSEEAHDLYIEGTLEQLDIDVLRGDDSRFELQRKYVDHYSIRRSTFIYSWKKSLVGRRF